MTAFSLKQIVALERFEAEIRTFSDAEVLGQLVGHRFAIDALEAIDCDAYHGEMLERQRVMLLTTLIANEATIQQECERRRLMPSGRTS